MKAKSITKRVLSAVLCAVMLFSCWVFTAPSASAADGDYYWKFTWMHEDSNHGMTNDSKDITIHYITQNGKGNEGTTTMHFDGDELDPDAGDTKEKTGGPINGFPYKIDMSAMANNNVSNNAHMHFRFYVSSDNSNWTEVAYSYQDISERTGWFNKDYHYASDITVGSDKYPTPSAVHTTSSSNWFWTGGMTVTGDDSTKSISYSPWLVDQYGVKWVHGTITHGYYLTNYGGTAISGTSTTAYGDVKINSNTGVVSSNTGGYCAGGNRTRQIKAKVWFKADNVTAYSVEDYFTITYTQYTATYRYYTTTTESAPSIKSGSGNTAIYHSIGTETSNTVSDASTNTGYKAYFGDQPANTPASGTYTTNQYYNASYHYSGTWAKPTLKSNADKYMTYTTTEHNWGDSTHPWQQIPSNNITENMSPAEYHRQTCDAVSGQTHYRYQKHQWNSGVITTAPTCTSTGIKTYTCTDCQATKTEVVAKDPANHNYGAWSDYGNAANHRRICSYDSSHIDYQAHTWKTTTVGGETVNRWFYDEADNPGDGTSASGKHYLQCSVCNYKLYEDHSSLPQEHVFTKVKTKPTCTQPGYDTYTCGAEGCGYTYVVYPGGEGYDPTGHDVTGKEYQYDASNHWKICNNCGEQVYDNNGTWTLGTIGHRNASAVVENRVEPTCTATGSYDSVIYCSDCHRELSRTANVIPATGHNYGAWTDDGADNHKRVCANDANHVETEEHTLTAWSNTVPEGDAKLAAAMKQDYDVSAECFRYCTVCYRVEYKAHKYTSAVTKEATCTEEGVTTYTCEYCKDSYTDANIPALGHNYVQDSVAPVDGGEDITTEKSVKAYEYFYCDRCNKSYCPAIYDETSGEYVKDTENAKSTLAEIEENVEEIPTPLFNDHKETYTSGTKTGQYYYDERSSSFKLMTGEDKEYTGANTKQDFRFSGSVQIPVDISYKIGTDTDNVITDFGYVYSQDSYIGSDPSRLVLNSGDAKIASLSVVGNKKTSNPVTQEAQNGGRLIGAGGAWSGVSYFHNNGDDTYELTFNLVISISAKNWKMQYAARPYVKYLYHGVEYTVYDGGATGVGYETYSHSAVFSNVVYGLTADAESPAVQAYCMERIIPHHNDFYPSTFKTEERIDEKTDWWQKLDIWADSGTTWEKFRKSDIYQAYIDLINPDSAQS